MLKDKEDNQTEELSQGIDIVNSGREPVVQDEEVKELLKIAAIVKQSYNQEDLPKELIAQMADNLAAELGEQKGKRRRYWLYSGFIGTVAAVIIAAFVPFLLPQAPSPNITQQIAEDSMETQKMVATADPSADSSTIAPKVEERISQPVQLDKGEKSASSKPSEEKSGDSVSMSITNIIQGTELPAIEQESNQMASLQREIPKDIAARKSVSMDETNMPSHEEKSIHSKGKIATMMVIPNQAAQTIKIDNVRGVIQQVYNIDNNDEIIITQRLLDESQAKGKANVKQSEALALARGTAIENAKENSNSITVKIDKYDITIEGKKSAEELQKIAESLAIKVIE